MFFQPGSPAVSRGSFRHRLGPLWSVAWRGPGASAGFPWVTRHLTRGVSWLLWPGACGVASFALSACAGYCLWKGTLGQGLVETEESARLADTPLHLPLPSQSEAPRGETGKHQLVPGRGSTRLPRHPPRPQSPGRRVGRKGKHRSLGRASGQTPEGSLGCPAQPSCVNTVFLPHLSILRMVAKGFRTLYSSSLMSVSLWFCHLSHLWSKWLLQVTNLWLTSLYSAWPKVDT